MSRIRPVALSLEPRVDTSAGVLGCWPWTGTRDGHGYGVFYVGAHGRTGAHRAAYELAHGPIPDGLFVCHRCDNPLCCNPAHLFLGTQKDNMGDAIAKGRLWRMDRSACVHGHPYNEANTYRRPGGGRDCRACIRRRVRAYQRRAVA